MQTLCKYGNMFETSGKTRRRCHICNAVYNKLWRAKRKSLGIVNKRKRIRTDATRAYQREYRKLNRDKARKWDNDARSRLNCFLAYLLKTAKSRSKHQCNLTISNLLDLWHVQQGKCAITAMAMTHEPNNLMSVSIDRINSNINYCVDNVHLVCRWVNFAKQHHPIEVIKDILIKFKTM